MNHELFRDYCLAKAGVQEEFPFGEDTLVFKVMGKMFALTSITEQQGSCNLKCDPEKAEELREKYSAITPGYHMNKKHWNTVDWDGSLSDQLIMELVDHSYELVKEGLPKAWTQQLNEDSITRKKKMKSGKKKIRKN